MHNYPERSTVSGLKLIAHFARQIGGDIAVEEDGTGEIFWPKTTTTESTRKIETLNRLIESFNTSVAALDVPLSDRRNLGRKTNPFASNRRLYRQHVAKCPHKKKGRTHIDCGCPIWMAAYMDGEGKLQYERSLRTRDWQHAEERRLAIENGQAITGMGRLYRRHYKSCRFRKLGMRHIACKCPIHRSAHIGADGKVVYSRSLRTRDWGEAKERLAKIEKGESVDKIVGTGRLFRFHSPRCPFKQLGRKHMDCNCIIRTESHQDGKQCSRSLFTRGWKEAQRRLKALEGGVPYEVIASMGNLFRKHERRCRFKKLGRSHFGCSCPIHLETYKGGKPDHSRSLRTRDVEEARRLLTAAERGEAPVLPDDRLEIAELLRATKGYTDKQFAFQAKVSVWQLIDWRREKSQSDGGTVDQKIRAAAWLVLFGS